MLAKKNKFLVMCLLALSLSSSVILPVKFYNNTIEAYVCKHPCFSIISDNLFSWQAVSGAIIGGLVGFNNKKIGARLSPATEWCDRLKNKASGYIYTTSYGSTWESFLTKTDSFSRQTKTLFRKYISRPLGPDKMPFASAFAGALVGLTAGALIRAVSTIQEDALSPSPFGILMHHANPLNGLAVFNFRFFFDEKLGRNALEFYQTYGAKTEFTSIKNILVCAHREYNLLLMSKAGESKIRAFNARLGQRLREEVSRLKNYSRYPSEADEVHSPFKDPTPEIKATLVEKN